MGSPVITIGRIVHYKEDERHTWPAMIIQVDDGDIQIRIRVFNRDASPPVIGLEDRDMAASPSDAKVGQWWWPERL